MALETQARCGAAEYGNVARANFAQIETRLVTLEAGSAAGLNVRSYGAVGDGTTDDTVAIQAALDAVTIGGACYFPAGTYAIRTLTATGKKIRLFGDGMQASMIVRHASYLQEESDLVAFTLCSQVSLAYLGFDQRGSGGPGSSKSCVSVLQSNNVLVNECYFTQGQYHGLAVTVCSNIKVQRSFFERCYYDGVAIGGAAGSAVDSFYTSITDNTFKNIFGGVICQVYCYDTVIAGNTFEKSNIQIGQAVDRLLVTKNIIHGNADYGFGASVSERQDGIFVESDKDVTVSNNIVRDKTNGYGIYINGSNLLSVPVTMQRIKVTANQVHNTNLFGILITMNSTSPAAHGDTLTVEDNTVTDCNSGLIVSGCNGSLINANYIYHCLFNGLFVGDCNNTVISNNVVIDVGYYAANTYAGITLDVGVVDAYLNDNKVIDTLACLRFGIWDKALEAGQGSQARYNGNVINTTTPLYPAMAPPIVGTFVIGDLLWPNPVPTVGQPLGWVYTAAGWAAFTTL